MASKLCMSGLGSHMLTCSICFEMFRKPKILPCLHSFCQSCLERHHEIYKVFRGGRLSCPSCRATIPLPDNGIKGFRSDTIVERTKQILKSLPNIAWKDVDVFNSSMTLNDVEESDKENCAVATDGPYEYFDTNLLIGGATEQHGIAREMIQDNPDPPEALKTCANLHKEQNRIQSVIANLRKKMLELYHIENVIKNIMENEVAEKTAKLDKHSKKLQKKIRSEVEEKYGPKLAMVMKEQDKLYQKIVEAKSVHDVVEEVLERTTVAQAVSILEFITTLQNSIQSIIKSERNSELCNLPLSEDVKNMAKMKLQEPCQQNTIQCLGDPRKLGAKLLFKISGYGNEAGKFDFPTHATFHPNGDLIVSDKNNLRLQVFDKSGQLKHELFNQKIKPRRARINPTNGNLYVSDEQSESVKVYSPSGELVTRIGERYFLCPMGIDFDSKGNLVMSDPEMNYISVHDSVSGKLLHRFFMRYFRVRGYRVPSPDFLTVNDEDQFIISDKRNGRIQVFTSNGQLLFQINGLNCPRGVCLDPFGNILVAEGDNHCISMYSPYGKFLQHLVDGKEHGLCYPLSVDMDQKGRLAITQCGYLSSHEVMVFQMC